MTKHKHNEKLEELKNSILSVLNHHYGIDNAISQKELLFAIKKIATEATSLDLRDIRRLINELRNEGYLICSATGLKHDSDDSVKPKPSGYYIPVTLEEFQVYHNYHAKQIRTNINTLRAMDKSASLAFPREMQPGLFDNLKESEMRLLEVERV